VRIAGAASPQEDTAMTLDKLYGKLPFAIQAKLYNRETLTDTEQARHQTVLTAITEAEERQYQATRAIFAKYCTIDPTK